MINNDEETINKKKANTLLVITIITFATIVIGAAYAYFNAMVDSPKSSPAKITAKTIDTLMLYIKDKDNDLQGTPEFNPLSIELDQDSLSELSGNQTDYVTATAELTPSNKPGHTVKNNYYLHLIIEKNTFIRSTKEGKPEILLKITKPDGGILQNLPDGTEISTVKNRLNEDVTGFDITTKTGVINILNNQEISTSTNGSGVPTVKTDEWKVELIFVNYNESQNKNAGKEFVSNIVLGTDEIGTTSTTDSITIKAPKRLSNGEKITNYTFKIKEASSTGNYNESQSQTSNNYTYTGLTDETNYDVKVIGQSENITEEVLTVRVSTKKAIPITNNLAQYIINNVSKVTNGQGLYKHTPDLTNGAKDNNYRYAGADPDNYVCMGTPEQCTGAQKNDYMFRIIGVFDNKVKLIKLNSIGPKLWNRTDNVDGDASDDNGDYNRWEYKKNSVDKICEMNRVLNNDYLTSLGEYGNKIDEHSWQIGGFSYDDYLDKPAYQVYELELGASKTNSQLSSPTKIGLIYVSDYLYAVPQDKWSLYSLDTSGRYNSDYTAWIGNDYSQAYEVNWLKDNFRTISRDTSKKNKTFIIAVGLGYIMIEEVNAGLETHPAFYLKPDTIFHEGNGKIDSPFRI